MREDPIVDEIHRVRREIATEFAGDVHAFFQYLRRREAERPDHVVTLEPVPPEPLPVGTPLNVPKVRGG
jgi:hypothetical protein